MSVLAFIVIILIVLAVESYIYKKYSFKDVDYDCSFSVAEATEGDKIFLVEKIYNGKVLPIPWIKAGLMASRWLEFAGSKSTVTQENRYVDSSFLLRSFQRTTRRWNVKCLKRGIFTCRGTVLITGDILGLQILSRHMSANATVIVYPATIDIDDLFIPASYIQGETVVRRWIIDDPFIVSGTREYSPSDPMNRIHWPASAHHGRLMVRKNDFTSQTSIAVMLNIQTMSHERSQVVYKNYAELGIRICATLFDIALHDGYQVRFCSNAQAKEMKSETEFSESASGREHIAQLMKVLAGIELSQNIDIVFYLESLTGKIVGSDIYFITSYFDRQLASLLTGFLEERNSVTVLAVKSIDPEALDMVAGLPGFYVYEGTELIDQIGTGAGDESTDTGTDTGADTGEDTGADTRADTGTDTGEGTGADTRADIGNGA